VVGGKGSPGVGGVQTNVPQGPQTTPCNSHPLGELTPIKVGTAQSAPASRLKACHSKALAATSRESACVRLQWAFSSQVFRGKAAVAQLAKSTECFRRKPQRRTLRSAANFQQAGKDLRPNQRWHRFLAAIARGSSVALIHRWVGFHERAWAWGRPVRPLNPQIVLFVANQLGSAPGTHDSMSDRLSNSGQVLKRVRPPHHRRRVVKAPPRCAGLREAYMSRSTTPPPGLRRGCFATSRRRQPLASWPVPSDVFPEQVDPPCPPDSSRTTAPLIARHDWRKPVGSGSETIRTQALHPGRPIARQKRVHQNHLAELGYVNRPTKTSMNANAGYPVIWGSITAAGRRHGLSVGLNSSAMLQRLPVAE